MCETYGKHMRILVLDMGHVKRIHHDVHISTTTKHF